MSQKVKGYASPPSELEKANEIGFREFFEYTVSPIFADDFMETTEISNSEKFDVICDAAEMYTNMKLINGAKPKTI